MKVLLFGGTGMVGQGVLRECLIDPGVTEIVAVGRNPAGKQHAKLRDLVVPDMHDLSAIEQQLAGFDACFFTLGTSAAGMTEERYARVTYDLTLGAARLLLRVSPQLTFIYVSGMGTDSTGNGRTMWARVKGSTENALLALGFKDAYMFRPGLIVPMHGITSRTTLYRVLYAILEPLVPLIQKLFPDAVTTTQRVGRAMIAVARHGYAKKILEPPDINSVAGSGT